MPRIIFTKFLLFYIIFVSNLSYAQNPDQFIKSVTEEASNILRQEVSKEIKSEKLITLAKRSVDIKGIGMYSLGKHKKIVTEDQLSEYQDLFELYFLKSFSSRLSEYSDPKINVIAQNVINEKYTIVSSVLVGNDKRPEIKIDWRVYTKDPQKPLIRDLIIEGLSLARTQREEFNSVIQGADGNVKVLFQTLKDFIKN